MSESAASSSSFHPIDFMQFSFNSIRIQFILCIHDRSYMIQRSFCFALKNSSSSSYCSSTISSSTLKNFLRLKCFCPNFCSFTDFSAFMSHHSLCISKPVSQLLASLSTCFLPISPSTFFYPPKYLLVFSFSLYLLPLHLPFVLFPAPSCRDLLMKFNQTVYYSQCLK